MTTSTQTIEKMTAQDYKYGFVTAIESDTLPPGLNEEVRPLHFRQEERAPVAFGLAAESPTAPWLTMKEAHLGQHSLSADRLSGGELLLGPQAEASCPRAWTTSTPSCATPTTNWASRSTSRRSSRASRWMRCSTACRWRPRSRRSWGRWASSSARSPRPCASTPSW